MYLNKNKEVIAKKDKAKIEDKTSGMYLGQNLKLRRPEAHICSFLWYVIIQIDRRFSGNSNSL